MGVEMQDGNGAMVFCERSQSRQRDAVVAAQ